MVKELDKQLNGFAADVIICLIELIIGNLLLIDLFFVLQALKAQRKQAKREQIESFPYSNKTILLLYHLADQSA